MKPASVPVAVKKDPEPEPVKEPEPEAVQKSENQGDEKDWTAVINKDQVDSVAPKS